MHGVVKKLKIIKKDIENDFWLIQSLIKPIYILYFHDAINRRAFHIKKKQFILSDMQFCI